MGASGYSQAGSRIARSHQWLSLLAVISITATMNSACRGEGGVARAMVDLERAEARSNATQEFKYVVEGLRSIDVASTPSDFQGAWNQTLAAAEDFLNMRPNRADEGLDRISAMSDRYSSARSQLDIVAKKYVGN